MAAADKGTVHYERDGAIAILTLDNPPVNALAKEVRVALAGHLDTAAGDDAVAAIVICGAGRNLCGGADIREFNTPARDVKPMSRDLMNAIEACLKPVVAAIHGPTLGGGLELALGCHYRVADARAQIGLPEVQRGVIPGAGGTQRLPRLVGSALGAELCLSGRIVQSDEALRIGLLNAVLPDAGFLDVAVAWCERIARNPAGAVFAAKRAVVQGLRLPIEEGLRLEGRLFAETNASDEAKRLNAAVPRPD